LETKNNIKHLAIIMDGNGRWAKAKGLLRSKGHEAGAKTIENITRFCVDHTDIKTLTLYAFSTENWKRPKNEVDFLMKLLERYLKKELRTYHKHKIRFHVIGDISKFSAKLQKLIQKIKEQTKEYDELTQVLALNYGARDEIVRAVQKLNATAGEISEESIAQTLDTPYGELDLLIRTGGERRLSNFLLWQLSYSELHFSDTLWPDFDVDELQNIIDDFEHRKRNFGGL
jgi:undecaprenyl diphosphate synthase